MEKKKQWAAVLEEGDTYVEWAFEEQIGMEQVEIFDTYEDAMERAVLYLQATIVECEDALKWLKEQTEADIDKRMKEMGAEEWLD